MNIARGSRDRLGASLGRTDKGQSRDLVTPLAKRVGRQQVTSDLVEIATRMVDPRLVQLEEDEAKKVGPLSIMLPWSQRRSTLQSYWREPEWAPDSQSLTTATERVLSLAQQSLRPLTFENATEKLPSNTALGLPLVTSDKQAIPEYLERARNIRSPHDIYPSICYWRGQARGPDLVPQQRVVFGFDHAETIASGRFLHPMIEVLKQNPIFSAWVGPDEVDTQVYTFLSPFVRDNPGSIYLSVDFSGFDTSVSRQSIHIAFNVIRKFYPQDAATLDVIEEVFATSGIVTPDGWHYGRTSAVPSGSALTNLVDCLVNILVLEYSSAKRGKDIRYLVQGDDSLVAGLLTAEELSEDAKELGMEVGEEKSSMSDIQANYLRKLYLFDNGMEHGIASIARRGSSLSGYERIRSGWSKWMESMRNIMLLEVCVHHPRFAEYVKYMFDGDEVLRSTDPGEVASRAGGTQLIEEKLGIESFRGSGRRVADLENFASVRLLRLLQSGVEITREVSR